LSAAFRDVFMVLLARLTLVRVVVALELGLMVELEVQGL